MSTELVLNLLGALHGMYHRREIDQERITDGFDDVTVMSSDGLMNELVMNLEQPQHAGFVRAHLTAEADHVGEHDGGELASLGCGHLR